jgi:hypothetical protein
MSEKINTDFYLENFDNKKIKNLSDLLKDQKEKHKYGEKALKEFNELLNNLKLKEANLNVFYEFMKRDKLKLLPI